MLMSPNKDETAVHGCHCQGDMAVRMRKVLQTAGLVFECVTCFFRVGLHDILQQSRKNHTEFKIVPSVAERIEDVNNFAVTKLCMTGVL